MPKVAIYVRLSREDENKGDNESESIVNQKTMLTSYAHEKGWEIYKIYADEDYSGSDDTRPAFNEMLSDAENHEFSIVLCKSLSRFARDVALVETYINGKFLDWGIRFISPTDYADTGTRGSRKNIQINSLVNQWYLEDLSDNIKGVLKHKKQQGQFLAAIPPYGYRKDPTDKHKLIIDENVRDVVNTIFSLALKEYTAMAIVHHLNNLGIDNPSTYFYKQGWVHVRRSKHSRWISSTVKRILHNEVYTGDLVQNKFENKTYKSKHSTPRAKEDWIITKGTHEGYISYEDFNKVQKLLGSRTKFYSAHTGKTQNYYRGLLFCGECGGALSIHSGGNKQKNSVFFRCAGAETGATMCKGTRVSKEWLDKELINQINTIVQNIMDKNELPKANKLRLNEKSNIENLVKSLKSKQESLNNALSLSFTEKAEGKITQDEFNIIRDGISKNIEETKLQLEREEGKLSEMLQTQSELTNFYDFVRSMREVTKLDRETLKAFVKRIVVNKRKSRKLFDYDVDFELNI